MAGFCRIALRIFTAIFPEVFFFPSSELEIAPDQVWSAGKRQVTVKVRSLLCYWAVKKLGFSTTELSKKTWCLAAICKYFGKAW